MCDILTQHWPKNSTKYLDLHFYSLKLCLVTVTHNFKWAKVLFSLAKKNMLILQSFDKTYLEGQL